MLGAWFLSGNDSDATFKMATVTDALIVKTVNGDGASEAGRAFMLSMRPHAHSAADVSVLPP